MEGAQASCISGIRSDEAAKPLHGAATQERWPTTHPYHLPRCLSRCSREPCRLGACSSRQSMFQVCIQQGCLVFTHVYRPDRLLTVVPLNWRYHRDGIPILRALSQRQGSTLQGAHRSNGRFCSSLAAEPDMYVKHFRANYGSVAHASGHTACKYACTELRPGGRPHGRARPRTRAAPCSHCCASAEAPLTRDPRLQDAI